MTNRPLKTILLLTATISPPAGLPLLSRTDPAQRLQDYLTALAFYLPHLGQTFDGIVFTDNSDSDLSRLRALVADAGESERVELLSFAGLDHPASYGRGYGEFKLIDHAMGHSRLLQDDAIVWKCTGRYVVTNIRSLVLHRPPVDIYCHLRNYPIRLCELFLLSFNRRGYHRVIEGAYRHLRNDERPGVHRNEEEAFRQLVDAWPADLRVARRFNRTPIIEGVRAWNNIPYSNARSPKILARRCMRVLAPWLWI